MRLKWLALGAMVLAGLAGCRRESAPGGVLESRRGQVLVLLLGAPGCPGTQAATEFLTGYQREAPRGVAILRLDVPVPGGPLGADRGPVAIPRSTDPERKVADRLEFFFYPTLYILDRDGEVRFAGGCEPARVREVVAALRAERPGEPKRSFTPPLLAPGSAAPAFAGKTPAGEALGSEQLRGPKAALFFFGATDCPFSNQALAALPGLVRDYGARGAAVAVITRSPAGEETARLHREQAPGVSVLCDPQGRIGQELYRVPAVPFFYALDGQGRITARGPFTEPAARAALDRALGLAGTSAAPASTGAG